MEVHTMRTINIPDKVYAQLQELLKEVQTWQLVRHGRLITETPEDVIPWLLGYYIANEEARLKIPYEDTKGKDMITRIRGLKRTP